MSIPTNNTVFTTPREFYDELLTLCRDTTLTDERRAHRLRLIFRIATEQALADKGALLCGLYQKLMVLSKQRHFSSALLAQLNATRQHLFLRHGDVADLRYDAKVIAEYVQALYPDCLMPKALQALLPADDRPITWQPLATHCLRCVVERWDDDYIYAQASADGSALQICYSADNRYLYHNDITIDWAYLRTLLRENMQLNLVYVRMEDGLCLPELIILDPDILIDVSTVASCFEPYAESAWVHLMHRLRPSTPTAATLLGNLASQFLDECVHGEQKDYAESIRDFFKHNALQMLSCRDLDPVTFHEKARAQRDIIRDLIGHTLPYYTEDYTAAKTLLEPSFVCETLGVQGRMDMMQSDYKVLIEQKSGKGAFPANPDPSVPRALDKHLAQLLLYRAVLHYGYRQPARELDDIFLLYSKYEKGLLRITPSPALLCRAIKVRNQLAWCETYYAETGFGCLRTLTPQRLNTNRLTGRLWDDFIAPQLTATLVPIQQASPIEQAYVLRMLQFVERESLLSKIGNRQKECSGFAALWQCNLNEKVEAGDIYYGLSIIALSMHGRSVERVTLAFSTDWDLDRSNFRRGDIVLLYPYPVSDAPDACRGIVFRAFIEDFTPRGLILRLRYAQADAFVFQRSKAWAWAVEHDNAANASAHLYRGIYAFLSAPQHRRDLLLGQRTPEVVETCDEMAENGDFTALVGRAQCARDFFLIIGPPGTGKTSFGLMSVLRAELANPNAAVLLLSYTNRAVDEICSKLVEAGLDFLRMGHALSTEPALRPYLMEERLAHHRHLGEVRQTIASTPIICGTTAAISGHPELFEVKTFSLAIVDEASQILEPHLLGILSAMHGDEVAVRRFVLIGDHKQLPAVVQQSETESVVADERLRAIGLTDCRRSLFERLLHTHGGDSRLVYTLHRQGRMHSGIADFPNTAFYEGQLDVVPLPHQVERTAVRRKLTGVARMLNHRFAFLHVSSPSDCMADKVNPHEATAIGQIVAEVKAREGADFDATTDVGIIVPYRSQIATIRAALLRAGVSEASGITIDTVERFQGSQRDYIIYGFTVQHRYQLNFLSSQTFEENGVLIDRKLNVALTRARRHCFVVGNADILSLNPVFHRLIAYTKRHRAYYAYEPTAP